MTSVRDTTAPSAALDDPVGALLAAVEKGAGIPASLFAAGARLDATLPNWRLGAEGAGAVADQLSGWFRHPARLERVRRDAVAGDDVMEVVEVELAWVEDGVVHGGHQLWRLAIEDGCIAGATIFCGGRWPAPLLAEMEASRAH